MKNFLKVYSRQIPEGNSHGKSRRQILSERRRWCEVVVLCRRFNMSNIQKTINKQKFIKASEAATGGVL